MDGVRVIAVSLTRQLILADCWKSTHSFEIKITSAVGELNIVDATRAGVVLLGIICRWGRVWRGSGRVRGMCSFIGNEGEIRLLRCCKPRRTRGNSWRRGAQPARVCERKASLESGVNSDFAGFFPTTTCSEVAHDRSADARWIRIVAKAVAPVSNQAPAQPPLSDFYQPPASIPLTMSDVLSNQVTDVPDLPPRDQSLAALLPAEPSTASSPISTSMTRWTRTGRTEPSEPVIWGRCRP